MTNKALGHSRPCFFAFQDPSNGLYWMIPISSRVEKYRRYYERNIKKYHKCDTIVFGEVLGCERAFLIQNMCPVNNIYIEAIYLDRRTNKPVMVAGNLEKEIVKKAKRILSLQRQGKQLIFPDVLSIEKQILEMSE